MFQHLCATLLQQSHLCPLPLEAQAVVWAHDAGLRLYPLPNALVLADPAPSTHCAFEGTVCLNPVRPAWYVASQLLCAVYVDRHVRVEPPRAMKKLGDHNSKNSHANAVHMVPCMPFMISRLTINQV